MTAGLGCDAHGDFTSGGLSVYAAFAGDHQVGIATLLVEAADAEYGFDATFDFGST